MKKTVLKCKAYAKINPFLEVYDRREDGYHDIVSVNQTVSLGDDLTMIYIPSDKPFTVRLICREKACPKDQTNLAVKAAYAYAEATGLTGKLTIKLTKCIPVSAGLGGGSSDAATVLNALNQISPNPLNAPTLYAVGQKLGADVPFCMLGGCAMTEGIGEILTPLPPFCPTRFIVLAKLGEGVSTREAYEAMDDDWRDRAPKLMAETMAQKIRDDADPEFYMHNGFQPSVSANRPKVAKLLQIMDDCGALNAAMSGSGPSVFGVFEKENKADHAVRKLKRAGAFAVKCYSIKENENVGRKQ